MEELTLEKFEEASEIVSRVTLETKLKYSEYFSNQTGNKVYFKPENMQYTGAYKVRGAYYKISTLSEEDRAKGIITASAGNHAQGVAYAAKLYNAKAVIVMPTNTPLIKINGTKSYGAEVVLYGDVYDDACEHALKLAEEHGYTFIHAFNDLDVACGQGSIAMEIIKELPTVDYILCPIGGGGLCTGVSTLAKMLNPKIKVIGVEPEGANCMQESLKADHVVSLPSVNTIADGTAVKRVGEKVFPYVQENVDKVITVEDDELIGAFLDMVENHKMIVENSGLLSVAALRQLDLKGKKVAVFGLGDQIRYPENFADGIGLLAEVFEGDGATLVGFTSSEGYTFERSRALRGDRWCGLVVDLDNQSEQAEKRIREWCEQVKNEFDSKP